jgi:DNA polymerase
MGGKVFDAMTDEAIQEIVTAWRKAHPRTRNLWYDMEAAARSAINNLGESFGVRDLITCDVKPDGQGIAWLRMKLPSGRYLCYPRPEVSDSGSLSYEGINQYTRKWERLDTYGGKLVENAVQAIARDVFMSGMLRAEEAGYSVCIRVHDELVCETPDEPAYSSEGLAALMSTNPSWSVGLPLAAAGFEALRYRKD